MYEIQKNHAFYYSLSVVRFAGIYPYFKTKILRVLHVVILQLIFNISWLVLLMLHMVVNIIDRTYYRLAEDLANLSADFGSVLCATYFVLNHKKWSKLFTDLTSFKEFGKPPKFDKVVKKYYYLPIIFYAYVTVAIVLYELASLADVPHCHKINKEWNLHEACGVFVPLWWPRSIEISFSRRTWVAIYLIASSQLNLPLMMIIPGICIECVELIVTRIDHLEILINDIFNHPQDLPSQIRRMEKWVRYHQHVIRLSEDLSYVAKLTNGYTLGLGALVLAFIGTQVRTESLPKGYLFALGYCVILFTVCHSGQRLFDETGKLPMIIFKTRWYNAPIKVQKYLPFIMLRCQKPSHIDAIPVGRVGYPLLLLMIKTSYSYVTFMDASINTGNHN